MSRYTLLFILILPFAIQGILSSVVDYKTKKISKKGSILISVLWSLVLAGVYFSQEVYNFLFSRQLTETEPMSLFDVVAFLAIVILLRQVLELKSSLVDLQNKQTRIIQQLAIQQYQDKKGKK